MSLKKYKTGEIVMHCQPFTYVVHEDMFSLDEENIEEQSQQPVASKICDFCLKFTEYNLSFKCLNCSLVYYCGVSCQRKAWKNHHQQECKIYMKVLNNPKLIKNFEDTHLRAQSFTSLKAGLRQDLNGISVKTRMTRTFMAVQMLK